MSENNNQNNNEVEELDINHLMQIRRDKLKELQEEGKDPFEITKFNRTNTAGKIKANYDEFAENDVTVAGRRIDKRIMGKASFCHIQDRKSTRLNSSHLGISYAAFCLKKTR